MKKITTLLLALGVVATVSAQQVKVDASRLNAHEKAVLKAEAMTTSMMKSDAPYDTLPVLGKVVSDGMYYGFFNWSPSDWDPQAEGTAPEILIGPLNSFDYGGAGERGVVFRAAGSSYDDALGIEPKGKAIVGIYAYYARYGSTQWGVYGFDEAPDMPLRFKVYGSQNMKKQELYSRFYDAIQGKNLATYTVNPMPYNVNEYVYMTDEFMMPVSTEFDERGLPYGEKIGGAVKTEEGQYMVIDGDFAVSIMTPANAYDTIYNFAFYHTGTGKTGADFSTFYMVHDIDSSGFWLTPENLEKNDLFDLTGDGLIDNPQTEVDDRCIFFPVASYLWASSGAPYKVEPYVYVVIQDRTAIETMDEVSLQINAAPMPATDRVSLTSTNAMENVAIFNMAGQKVMDVNVSGNNVDLNLNLAPGMYVAKVKTEAGMGTVKLLVK